MRWIYSAAAMSVMWGGSLCADSDVEARVSLLECKMKQAYDDTVYDCVSGARFASGRPGIDSYGLWVVGNVLYWTAYEGGTEIAVFDKDFGDGSTPVLTKPVSFNWDVGYRIGAGWVTPRDNMEFAVLFTRIEPEGKFHMSSVSPDRVDLVIQPGLYEKDVSSHWNVKYSTLDIEFGRAFFLSKYFYVRPHFGTRTAWIRQWASLYSNPVPNPNPVFGHFRNDFSGTGLRLGSDSKWFFAKHFNVFLGASLSSLYGKYTVGTSGNQEGQYNLDLASSVYRIETAAQTQMGLGWETDFSCNGNFISINLGYELNYWWRQNQQPVLENIREGQGIQLYGVRQSKDLSFHGMTVDMQLAF